MAFLPQLGYNLLILKKIKKSPEQPQVAVGGTAGSALALVSGP